MPVPVLTAAAMRQADQTTIESFGIPGFTLMEAAGRATADLIIELLDFLEEDSILILCGKGNNGGDGLVVARQLAQYGCAIDVVLMDDGDSLSGDARSNLVLLQKLVERDADVDVEIVQLDEWTESGRPGHWEVIVDALLGTGLQDDLRDPISGLVDWINSRESIVVSIDLPTGLDTDLGILHGTCVEADHTVTMGALKVGLLLNDGPEYAGEVEVAEIGIPDFALLEAADADGCAWLVSDDDIVSWFPQRSHDAHKYSAGMVLAVVGSTRYTGAAIMSTLSALRVGAGYVIAGVPASIKDTLAEQLVEVALEPLSDTEEGSFDSSALSDLSGRLEKANSLLVGCGVGKEEETFEFIRELIRAATVPGVLDADGLSALPGHFDILNKPEGMEWILTPHLGEFRRLVDDETLNWDDRVGLASRFAREWGCVMILKGMPSVVGCPDGRVYINATGNPALATAGTGDVLAGLCAGLLAQGLTPVHAAVSGLHIGGAAADLFVETADPRTMIATDLVELIPETIAMRF